MAFGNSTFSDLSGAVGDILGGQANAQGLRIKAEGIGLDAEGMRLKAKGDLVEAGNYDLASTLAHDNATFTKESTAIQLAQAQRQIYLGLGETQSDIGGSGFAMSGSALDLMRSGAQQGELAKQVITKQGAITEAGYEEQGQAYTNLAGAARFAAGVEQDMASKEDNIASETNDLAGTTERNGYITGAIKGAAAIATLFV